MAYTDVITVAEAKDYLKVDPGVTEDDALIGQLIEAALQYVEEATNTIVDQRNKDYAVDHNRQVRVYDDPINTVVTPSDAADYNATVKPKYVLYDIYDGSLDVITLNVGHAIASNVPAWVKPIGLALVNAWYNDVEVDSQEEVPARIKSALRRHKRFIL